MVAPVGLFDLDQLLLSFLAVVFITRVGGSPKYQEIKSATFQKHFICGR